MSSSVKPFDHFSVPRVAQLTQRSNQFNLRTLRYSEEDIKKIVGAQAYLTLSFTLKDKYGDHGLISTVILQKQERALFIDTWVMSCRVLKRGLEEFILNEMAALGRSHGFTRIIGEYLPTAKNGLVKDLYAQLGFLEKDKVWVLELNEFTERKHFIKND